MSLDGTLCARLRSSQAETVRPAFNRLNRLYGTTLQWPSGTASPSLAALVLAWSVTKIGNESPQKNTFGGTRDARSEHLQAERTRG
eukprot:5734765-Pleurochrysis_carterae.AAC.1